MKTGIQVINFLRRRYLLTVSIGIIMVCILISHLSQPKLTYNGRPIGYWFERLPETSFLWNVNGTIVKPIQISVNYNKTDKHSGDMAVEAFSTLGADALPYLMEKFSAKDSKIEIRCRKFCRDLGINQKWLPFTRASINQKRAISGILLMNPFPANGIDELDRLLKRIGKSPGVHSPGIRLEAMLHLLKQQEETRLQPG